MINLGSKLLWTGLTLLLAVKAWNPLGVPAVEVVGAVLMVLGCVLMWLDK